MKWAPSHNAAPATSAQLRESAEAKLKDIANLEAEVAEITAAIPLLINEPERAAEGKMRLRDLAILIPCERDALKAIEKAVPDAEDRERRAAFQLTVDERVRQRDKLKRGLEARYTKAADAYAEVCREIEADAQAWRVIWAQADCFTPRAHVPHHSAEHDLRYTNFAGSNGLIELTREVTVRAWNGEVLFRS